MDKFYYTYVLQSEKDGLFYTGFTNNLNRRIQEHNDCKVASTRKRTPFRLIYWEGCIDINDATKREKILEIELGETVSKKWLNNYLTG